MVWKRPAEAHRNATKWETPRSAGPRTGLGCQGRLNCPFLRSWGELLHPPTPTLHLCFGQKRVKRWPTRDVERTILRLLQSNSYTREAPEGWDPTGKSQTLEEFSREISEGVWNATLHGNLSFYLPQRALNSKRQHEKALTYKSGSVRSGCIPATSSQSLSCCQF